METLTIKEFLEQLNSDNFIQPFTQKGIVKKSDNNSEILFKRKGAFEHWIAIPEIMIESVMILKIFQKENQTYVVSLINFKPPTTLEGIILQKLIASDTQCEFEHCVENCSCSCQIRSFEEVEDRCSKKGGNCHKHY